MEIIAFQNRIINLDNVTSIRRFRPGNWRPYPKQLGEIIDYYEIWFELDIPSICNGVTCPLSVKIIYTTEADRDSDWEYILASFQREPNPAGQSDDEISDNAR